MNLPRQLAGTLLAIGGLMIALSMPSSCHGQAAASPAAIVPLASGSWVPTGSLVTARHGHTATLLPNGKVLVAGGRGANNATLDSAELYDPVTGTWSLTGSMQAPRVLHTATLLSTGKVLVVGGDTGNSQPNTVPRIGTAELYDPASGTWTLTGNPHSICSWHTATLLQNGNVLAAGGFCADVVNAAELYDPATGLWTVTGSLITARYGHTATLLQDGRVLIARGSDDGDLTSTLGDAELYDPVAGTWSAAGSSSVGSVDHTATLLPNGEVLVTGGYGGGGFGGAAGLGISELFDPATRSWSGTGNLVPGRSEHTATLLPTGEVLVAGGLTSENRYPNLEYINLDSTETYDLNAGLWTSTATLGGARAGHTATLLSDGRVLVAGGAIVDATATTIALNSAEVYGGVPLPGVVSPAMTGAWYDPAQSGHGIFLEILPNHSAFLGWFSFDPAGTQQVWFGGVGTYSGNAVTFDAIDMPTGGRWIPNFDPARIVHNAWGSLKLTFTDADHGRADFTSVLGYGSGSMTLTRLTQPVGSSPLDTSIGHPTGVATDSMGNVYFNSPSVVFKLDTQGNLTRVAGSLSSGYSGDGGAATQALLNFPYPYPELVADPLDWSEFAAGLTVDAAGNIYIADSYNHRVRKVDPRGIITTIAGDGTVGVSGDGGMATAARVGWPQAVATDAGGNLYVSAWTGLRKVTPDGIITTRAAINCGSNGPGVCGSAGVAVDGNGNVYIADGLCRIRELTPNGSTIDWEGSDLQGIFGIQCGFSGDGGPATSAAFNYPYGVATDKSGNVYVADTYNNRIRKVDTSGIISTVAGGPGQGFSGDGGLATNARLYQPHGVAVSSAGDLYIADTGNNRIRKVSSDGTITTIAGKGDRSDITLANDTGNIGTGHSGAWYDPTQSGHGIFLEILPGNSAFLGWFTFNPAGTQQVWFGGVGTYSGNTLTISAVDQPTGGRWIPNFNPAQIVHNAWGSMVLTFTDCNHGRVGFNSTSGYGIGSMNLVRLTQPAGTSCP